MGNDEAVFARAMGGYERARLIRATLMTLPTVLIPCVAFLVGGRLLSSVALGGGLWLAVLLFSWRGQALGKSVPAGLLAGMFPLVLALGAQRIGHLCTPDGCTSLCVPMCSIGGVAAGWVVAAAAQKSPAPKVTLLSGALVAGAVGAMGCSCVGFAGMLGMCAGMAMAISISAVIRRVH